MPSDKHSSKHKRSSDRDRDKEHKSKKRHKHRDDEGRTERKRKRDGEGLRVVDDDPNDEDMWVEKNIDNDGERVRIVSYYRAYMSSFGSPASRNRHSYLRKPEPHHPCRGRPQRPPSSVYHTPNLSSQAR